jgi:hypothetical protein
VFSKEIEKNFVEVGLTASAGISIINLLLK